MNAPAKLLPANHAWKLDESLDLYQVEAWGKGYFSINEQGHVVIRPSMEAGREIDLYDVVQGLKARDLHTPVVIRFSDILAHRLRHLAEAFGTAIAENDYKNRYAAVFPIKVNQQRLVVEEVYRYGKEFGFGLEVGSKPELLAVMSINEDAPDRIVVCNGFKDDSYIEAVILATKLGRTFILVVENFEEIHLILKHAERYGVRPMIVSEPVRAIAAHHSLLVFDTLGSSKLDQFKVTGRPEEDYHGKEEVPQPVLDLFDSYRSVNERRLVECYHDGLQAREQALQMFNLGYLSLEFRALAEKLYWATCSKIRDYCRKLDRVPEELENLEEMLSDIYFCNFSVFQSLPDSWAIGQLFPIMPIQRLGERPSRNAVLADITCDSDGKIDRFVHPRDTKRTLEVHELTPGEPYYLAAFLVGAYQETLGDLHNLFGDTHVVHIRLQDGGGWWIEEIVKGDTANKVLEYMEYDTDELYPRIARDCERAIQEGRMTLGEAQAVKRFYENELNGYAYLEVE